MPDEMPDDYVTRVNRVVDHVLLHLDEDLPLERLAKVAAFSPFHFHRVFKMLMHETLADFVKRARLERALRTMASSGKSLTEIALECGFASSSDFSRSFKARYGVPPGKIDVEQVRADRREEWTRVLAGDGDGPRLPRLPPGENPDRFVVSIVEMPPRTVLYLRAHRPYENGNALRATERLVAWADERGLGDGTWLGWSWQDPDVTPLESCLYDVGVEVPAGTQPEGDVCRIELPRLRVADVAIRGGIELEMRALDWLFGTWLPRSGETPDDHPTFEVWEGRPYALGFETLALSIQLPLR